MLNAFPIARKSMVGSSCSAAAALALAGTLFVVAPAAGQQAGDTTPADHESEQIRKLIIQSGASDLGVQLLSIVEQQIVAALLEANPKLSPEAGPIVHETVGEVLGGDISGLITRMIPSYAAAFSPEEIDALVAFYESPAGSKLRAQTPTLMRASMKAGQNWVNEHQPDMDSLMKKRLDTAGIAIPES